MTGRRALGLVAVLAAAAAWLASGYLGRRAAALPDQGPLPVSQTEVGRATARLALGMKGLTSPAGAAAYTAPTRNPFRFGAPTRPPAPGTTPVGASRSPRTDRAPWNAPPERPPMLLIGVAEDPGPDGPVRRAVIRAGEELFVVGTGDLVLGRFRVTRIDPEAVELEDLRGGPTTVLALG